MKTRITICLLIATFVCAEADAQNRKYRRRGVILGGLAGAALGIAIGDKGDNETAGALIGGAVGAFAGGTIGNQKDQRIEHDQRYHSGYRQYYDAQTHPSHSQYGHPANPYSRPAYSQPSHALPAYDQPYVYPHQTQPTPSIAQPIEQPTPSIAQPIEQPTESFLPQGAQPVVMESEPFSGAVTIQDIMTMTRSGMSSPLIIRQIELHGVARQLSVSEVIELHKAGVNEDVIESMQTWASSQTSSGSTPDRVQSYSLPPFTGETSILPAPANSRQQ